MGVCIHRCGRGTDWSETQTYVCVCITMSADADLVPRIPVSVMSVRSSVESMERGEKLVGEFPKAARLLVLEPWKAGVKMSPATGFPGSGPDKQNSHGPTRSRIFQWQLLDISSRNTTFPGSETLACGHQDFVQCLPEGPRVSPRGVSYHKHKQPLNKYDTQCVCGGGATLLVSTPREQISESARHEKTAGRILLEKMHTHKESLVGGWGLAEGLAAGCITGT